jgi:GAF domain-containing protein
LGGSLLCVPLLSGHQLFGTIAVASPSLAAFQTQAITFLQILADQTILAISKARQIEASQQQAQELAAILDVAKAMTSTVEASQILRTIVVGIRRLVSCDDVVIFGIAEQAQELRAVARLGVSEDNLEDLRISIHDKQSIAAWVAQNRRPIIQAPGGRLFLGRVTGILLGEDDLAVLSAPLLSKDHLHGVVLLTRFIPFEASELRIVLNLCNLVAIAMEHVPIPVL